MTTSTTSYAEVKAANDTRTAARSQRRSSSDNISKNIQGSSSFARRRSSANMIVFGNNNNNNNDHPAAAYETIGSLHRDDNDRDINNHFCIDNNNDDDDQFHDDGLFFEKDQSLSNSTTSTCSISLDDGNVNDTTGSGDDLYSDDHRYGAGYQEYVSVLKRYPAYRAYLISHVCQNLGDWFVRIASILIVEELAASGSDGDEAGTGQALSYMTLARLLPNAVFAQIGGVLADRLDRRDLMVAIDILSGIVVLGFLVAIRFKSLEMFYVVTCLRSALAATYYPATTGIVPLLVGMNHRNDNGNNKNPRDLQLAVTMNSWAWGWTGIIGGLLAGTLSSVVGLEGCYLIDFVTYWISAAIIALCVKGNFKVRRDDDRSSSSSDDDHNNQSSYSTIGESKDGLSIGDHPDISSNNGISNYCYLKKSNPIKSVYGEFRDLFVYLSTCGFGMMIFLKASASLVWGIEDIVGAQFSTVFRDDGTEDEELSSVHMGLLFSTVGLGCMTGPVLLNLITDARQPYTLQRACWIGMLFLTGGWLAISLVQNFPQFLVGSFFRTMGSGTVWVNSALVLQTLSDPKILGRVLAAEYTLTTLFEAASVTATGKLSMAGFSKNMLALFGASLGILMLLVWGIYYLLSLGAANPRFNNNYKLVANSNKAMRQKEIEMGDVIFSDNSETDNIKSQKIIVFA